MRHEFSSKRSLFQTCAVRTSRNNVAHRRRCLTSSPLHYFLEYSIRLRIIPGTTFARPFLWYDIFAATTFFLSLQSMNVKSIFTALSH